MKNYLSLASKRPWTTLLLLTLISIGAAVQLPKLLVQVSPNGLVIDDDPATTLYERARATFGNDESVLIFVRDPELFQYDRLEAIRATVARLEALSFVARTESLYTLPYLHVVDDMVHTDPYLAVSPRTPDAAERIRRAALDNPFVRRNLLAEDGSALAIRVVLDPASEQRGRDATVTRAIEAAIRPLSAKVEDVFQTGAPSVRALVRDTIVADQRLLLPLALLVLVATLGVIQRSFGFALLPLLTAGLSVLWTLGGMATLSIPLNVMTAIVPVLLVIVGSTEDIHLIAGFREATQAGYDRRRAICRMARRMGLAVLLTFATSYLGFAATALNPIPILREFGFVAATGLAFNFAITVALLPAFLQLFGRGRGNQRDKDCPSTRASLPEVATVAQARSDRWLGAAALVVTAVSAYGALSVRVNNNLLDYFPADAKVHQQVATVQKTLSGTETFEILLDAQIEGTFQRERYLREIIALQDHLARSPAFDTSLSIADYLMLLDRSLNDPSARELPDDDVLAELASIVEYKHVAGLVSADYSRARVAVRHGLGDSQALSQALAGLTEFIAANLDPGLHPTVTGESVLRARATDAMALGQAQSLGLMLVAIFALVSLLFLNLKAGWGRRGTGQRLSDRRAVRRHGLHRRSARHRQRDGCSDRAWHKR